MGRNKKHFGDLAELFNEHGGVKLATMLGVSGATLYRELKEQGVTSKQDQRSKYSWGDLAELYEKYTVEEIAVLKGCRWNTVACQLRKINVKFMDQYQRQLIRTRTYTTSSMSKLGGNLTHRNVVRNILINWGCAPEEVVESMRGKQVHHKDGNHKNNTPENLMLVTIKEHSILHNISNYITCPHCGGSLCP